MKILALILLYCALIPAFGHTQLPPFDDLIKSSKITINCQIDRGENTSDEEWAKILKPMYEMISTKETNQHIANAFDVVQSTIDKHESNGTQGNMTIRIE